MLGPLSYLLTNNCTIGLSLEKIMTESIVGSSGILGTMPVTGHLSLSIWRHTINDQIEYYRSYTHSIYELIFFSQVRNVFLLLTVVNCDAWMTHLLLLRTIEQDSLFCLFQSCFYQISGFSAVSQQPFSVLFLSDISGFSAVSQRFITCFY